MMSDLFNSFSAFDDAIEKQATNYSGLLGLTADPNSAVEVPNRAGYIYVRFRDNQSEVISVYNDKVSPVHNLPVIVTRKGSRWIIVGRDLERYENWGSYSAFLPEHGFQHEFPRDNPGGDIVYSYIDQFMPLNVYPSGTPGSPNVLVAGYSYKKSDNTWAYVGETGTPSVLLYKPTDNQARMVLVYMDRDTGNPGILVNSGTSLAANLTGTADILPYLPPNTALQEPLKAIRLVSGTNYIEWNNLYDVRQIFNRDITGSGGGVEEAPIDGFVYGRKDAGWIEVSGTGGSTPTFDANRIVITDNSGNQTVDDHLYYNFDDNVLILGTTSVPVTNPTSINVVGSGTAPRLPLWNFGSGTQPQQDFVMVNGDWNNPVPPWNGQALGRISWRPYTDEGVVGYITTHAAIEVRAVGDFVSGTNTGTEIVMGITPSGTTSMMDDFLKVNQSGADMLYGTYNISGSPHTHDTLVSKQMLLGNCLNTTVPASSTYYAIPGTVIALQTPAYNTEITEACNISGLRINISNTQPASGSLVVTVQKNNVDTGITITIPADSPTGVYTESSPQTVAFVAGDLLIIKVQNNATATSAPVTRHSLLATFT